MSAQPDHVVSPPQRSSLTVPGDRSDSAPLRAFLSRIARRLMLIGAAEGAAIGIALNVTPLHQRLRAGSVQLKLFEVR